MAGEWPVDLSAENLGTPGLFGSRMVVVKNKGGKPDDSRDVPARRMAEEARTAT